MTFGERINALRSSHGWSLTELHNRTGVARSHLWKIEKDQTEPTVQVARQIARAFGVSLSVLVGEESVSDLEINRAVAARKVLDCMADLETALGAWRALSGATGAGGSGEEARGRDE